MQRYMVELFRYSAFNLTEERMKVDFYPGIHFIRDQRKSFPRHQYFAWGFDQNGLKSSIIIHTDKQLKILAEA